MGLGCPDSEVKLVTAASFHRRNYGVGKSLKTQVVKITVYSRNSIRASLLTTKTSADHEHLGD